MHKLTAQQFKQTVCDVIDALRACGHTADLHFMRYGTPYILVKQALMPDVRCEIRPITLSTVQAVFRGSLTKDEGWRMLIEVERIFENTEYSVDVNWRRTTQKLREYA